MARTLEAYAPNSLSSFTVKVIVAGAVTETITMAHVAAEPGTWRGTIAQAGSNGEAKLSYYWNGSAAEAGIFFADISAIDGTTSYGRDLSLVQWPPRNATGTVNLSNTNVGTVTDVAAALANKLADVILRRTRTSVQASSDGEAVDVSSLYGFLGQAQKSSRSGTTLTVKNADGSTLGTLTLTQDADANPITGVT